MNWTTKQRTFGICTSISGFVIAGALAASVLAAPTLKPRVIQTNYAADNISIIDPATDKVVGHIEGIELNHGVAVSPDAKHIYVSDEAEETLDIVDGQTLQVTKRIPLDGHPNKIAIARDGSRVYVALLGDMGGVDAIDTKTEAVEKHIATGSTVHNPYVTPDGKFVLAGSQTAKKVSVIDAKTEEVVWEVPLGAGVRPMTMSVNPDGSTKWLFVQVTGFNGFVVVDFATHKEITRIALPAITAGKKLISGGGEISHGMAVTKDQKTLLVNSRVNTALYAYSLPDLKLKAQTELGGKGCGWMTLSPDRMSKVYVANTMTDDVSVVDIATMKEVALIHVGYSPKRNITAMMMQ
jgi:YVTN family beta-propeller protein